MWLFSRDIFIILEQFTVANYNHFRIPNQYLRTIQYCKVNSVQEAYAKCFAVHILEFETLANHMKVMKQRILDLFSF